MRGSARSIGLNMTKNMTLLLSFTAYCYKNPEERFWQALRNWSGQSFILASDSCPVFANQKDTFYWEGRDGSTAPNTKEGKI